MFIQKYYGILRSLILDSLEYVINPSLNILEEPLTDVIVLESKPPVQDSATEILIFLLIDKLIIFLIKNFIS